MEIAKAFAGYTLGEADLLRRAIGKKEKELMENLREEFVSRSVERNIPREIAEKIFDLIEKFAHYGFNKSHSAAYALIAYQTAYLKAHYPIYFIASILTYEASKSEEVSKYLAVANELGIKILPPDINKSEAGFTVEGNAIRIGLYAIKNVGEEAVNEILKKRPYKSFIDFCSKVDTKKVNKKTIEALIKAGAFDSLEPNRAKLMHNLSSALSVANQAKFSTLFKQGALLSLDKTFTLEEAPPWDLDEKLNFEKEALGFYLTDHPMKRFRRWINIFSPYNMEKLKEVQVGTKVLVAGVISEIKVKSTKNGDKMAILKIEDEKAILKALTFPELYKQYLHLFTEGAMLWFKGEIDKEDENSILLIEDVSELRDLKFFKNAKMNILLSSENVNEETLEFLKNFLIKEETKDVGLPIQIYLKYPDCLVCFEINGYKIDPTYEQISLILNTFDKIHLRVTGT